MQEHKKAIGIEFKRMEHIIMRHLHARMAAEGFDELTIMHGRIMGFLFWNKDRAIYQKDLEDSFGIARSTVTNILKLMEKKGYVTRTQDEKDTRLKRLQLTPLGMEIQEKTKVLIDRFHDEMEMGITDEEREVFYRIIGKLQTNIENCDGNEVKTVGQNTCEIHKGV